LLCERFAFKRPSRTKRSSARDGRFAEGGKAMTFIVVVSRRTAS